jgi:hypothetical protein
MTRPLLQQTIGQLEEMFSNSPTDTETLKQLTQELECRKTPRAAALLLRVQQALSSGTKGNVPDSVPLPDKAKNSEAPSLATLWEAPSHFGSVDSGHATRTVLARVSDAPLKKPPTSQAPPKSFKEMPLADAYKILKSAPDAAWVTIENNRRRLVSASNPLKTADHLPEKRKSELSNAELINVAYLNIWKARYSKE